MEYANTQKMHAKLNGPQCKRTKYGTVPKNSRQFKWEYLNISVAI